MFFKLISKLRIDNYLTQPGSLYSVSAGVFLIAALVFGSGCSLPLNEKQSKPSKPEAKLSFDSKCLKEIGTNLSAWADGDANDAQLNSTWNCLDAAVDVFKNKVVGKGSPRDEYAPEEVASFFQGYVLKEAKFDTELMNELMLIKVLLLGGDEKKITRAELERFRSLISLLREISVETKSHMKVYTSKWSREARGGEGRQSDLNQFETSQKVLRSSALKLTSFIVANKTSYDLGRLPVLFAQLQKLSKTPMEWIPKVNRYVPLLLKLKKSLVGGDEKIVQSREWNAFGSGLAGAYTLYLKYEYFLKGREDLFQEGSDLLEVENVARDGLEFLASQLEQRGAELSAPEIFELVQALRELAPSLNVSSGLIDQILVLKRSFFGGSPEALSARDARNAVSKLSKIREIGVRFLDNKKFYLQDWAKTSDVPTGVVPEAQAREMMNRSENQLPALALELAALMEQDYDLRKLPALLSEVEKLVDSKSQDQGLAKYTDVIISLKQMIVGDSTSVISVKSYERVFAFAARGYLRYLEYHYFISHYISGSRLRGLTEGVGLRSLSAFGSSALDLLQMLPDGRNEKVIPYSEMFNLWLAARKADLLPKDIKDETVQNLLPILFNKILVDPKLRLKDGFSVMGMTKLATDYLRVELGSYVFAQSLSQMLKFPLAQAEALETWSNALRCYSQAESLIAACLNGRVDPLRSSLDREQRIQVITEMEHMFRSKLSVSHGRGQRLSMGLTPLPYDFASFSDINLSRSISRLLIHSYASKQSGPSSFEWTSEDAKAALKDLNPIAADLKFIEANNSSFATLRFYEANLFTPHSDGSNEVNLREMSSLVLFIMSGLSHHSSLDERIRTRHCVDRIRKSADGDARFDLVEVSCVLSAYRTELDLSLPEEDGISRMLPQMSAYLKALSLKNVGEQSSFDLMLFNLMTASGWKNDGSGWVKMKDISLIVHVMQYIETVMQRLDGANAGLKDGILRRSEALQGYPIFRNIINVLLAKDDQVASVLELTGEPLTKATYAYVLYHGGIPTCAADKKELLKWTIFPQMWKTINAERNKLGEILAVLSEMTRKKDDEAVAGRCFY